MKNRSRFGADWDKLGSNVYSGSAEFGKDYTFITTIIACIFSFFLFIFGIYLTFRKPKYTKQTQMIISSSTSSTDSSGNVTYKNVGKVGECKNDIELIGSENISYSPGDTVNVFIKPDLSCEDAELHEDNTKWLGIIFIIVSVLIIAFSLIKLFFVKKYKGVAAAAGVVDVFNMFRR